jgi:glycosyltransferase involved in cell wall biosynthesis
VSVAPGRPEFAAPVLAIYPHDTPDVGRLYDALRHIHPMVGASGVRLKELAALALGHERDEYMMPRPVPMMPWGQKWRASLHGPILRRIGRGARAVIFTRPDQAPLLPAFADAFKVYHAIDDYTAYARPWNDQERVILAAADHVIAVSHALGRALAARHPIADGRLSIVPNAVSAALIPARCPERPAPLPEGLDLPRPIAGVLGRVSSRLRLGLLLGLAERLPWLHWLYVGDVEAAELLAADRPVLRQLQRRPNCTFVGRRPYRALPDFARALDVAVMPYSGRSTNPLGSSVRMFLHLPFGAPIVATRGCLQVEEFSPLVTMCDSAETMAGALEALRGSGFDDGLRQARWQAASMNTWEERASRIAAILARAAA